MALTFDMANRRSLTERELIQSFVNEKELYEVIFILLSDAFERNLKGFYALDLRLKYLETAEDYAFKTITSTYWFSGSVILETLGNGLIDATVIPSEQKLQQQTLQAFSNYQGDVSTNISEATDASFKSWVISKVNENEIDASKSGSVTTVTSGNNSTMTITMTASIVAIISTLTAFGLIYYQTSQARMKNDELVEIPTPDKQPGSQEMVMTARKIRSPFLTVTPGDGTRKYFSKLDDESVTSSRQQIGKDLNPNQSLVDSSFEESSYAGSLQAPSIAGSKLGGQSVDQESLAGMSALDNVRLNKVLQLDDDDVDSDKSVATNDTGVFRRIWYGNKQKFKKEGSIKKLSPSSKDTPTKSSPKKASPTKSVKSSPKTAKSKSPSFDENEPLKEDVDDASLLGDQSNKGEYYGLNEDCNLFYNMLGDRSDVVSESSDDINFNDMYNGDGVASSSCNSVQYSDTDTMSRASYSQTQN